MDFGPGIQGLSVLVAGALAGDSFCRPFCRPFCLDELVFCGRFADGLKLLAADRSGMILATKRRESWRFTWPAVTGGAVIIMPARTAMLGDGFDSSKVRPIAAERPQEGDEAWAPLADSRSLVAAISAGSDNTRITSAAPGGADTHPARCLKTVSLKTVSLKTVN